MSKPVVLILGPQGSGKSTQAIQLAEFLDYKFISTGQEVRKASQAGNELSKKMDEFWKEGNLVPDSIIENEILFPLMLSSGQHGFVIDGYPRNITQINNFLNFLDDQDWAITYVFYLHVGEDECLKRLRSRSLIESRADESDESIKNRLNIFHKETEPLLVEYSNMGRLHRIDGERTVEDIQEDLRSYFSGVEFVEPTVEDE
ncbi:MAG: adenylate kinase [Patescibacteria group bacterium]|nr:adenylate kinase [Patescibacteria group bacterium]